MPFANQPVQGDLLRHSVVRFHRRGRSPARRDGSERASPPGQEGGHQSGPVACARTGRPRGFLSDLVIISQRCRQ